jgi:hypothetical protein
MSLFWPDEFLIRIKEKILRPYSSERHFEVVYGITMVRYVHSTL